jgi:hypothetical protein
MIPAGLQSCAGAFVASSSHSWCLSRWLFCSSWPRDKTARLASRLLVRESNSSQGGL